MVVEVGPITSLPSMVEDPQKALHSLAFVAAIQQQKPYKLIEQATGLELKYRIDDVKGISVTGAAFDFTGQPTAASYTLNGQPATREQVFAKLANAGSDIWKSADALDPYGLPAAQLGSTEVFKGIIRTGNKAQDDLSAGSYLLYWSINSHSPNKLDAISDGIVDPYTDLFRQAYGKVVPVAFNHNKFTQLHYLLSLPDAAAAAPQESEQPKPKRPIEGSVLTIKADEDQEKIKALKSADIVARLKEAKDAEGKPIITDQNSGELDKAGRNDVLTRMGAEELTKEVSADTKDPFEKLIFNINTAVGDKKLTLEQYFDVVAAEGAKVINPEKPKDVTPAEVFIRLGILNPPGGSASAPASTRPVTGSVLKVKKAPETKEETAALEATLAKLTPAELVKALIAKKVITEAQATQKLDKAGRDEVFKKMNANGLDKVADKFVDDDKPSTDKFTLEEIFTKIAEKGKEVMVAAGAPAGEITSGIVYAQLGIIDIPEPAAVTTADNTQAAADNKSAGATGLGSVVNRIVQAVKPKQNNEELLSTRTQLLRQQLLLRQAAQNPLLAEREASLLKDPQLALLNPQLAALNPQLAVQLRQRALLQQLQNQNLQTSLAPGLNASVAQALLQRQLIARQLANRALV